MNLALYALSIHFTCAFFVVADDVNEDILNVSFTCFGLLDPCNTFDYIADYQVMMMFQEEPVVEKPKAVAVKQPIKNTIAEKENGQPPKKIT